MNVESGDDRQRSPEGIVGHLVTTTGAELLTQVASMLGQLPLNRIIADVVREVERHLLEEALRSARGNRTRASEILGLSRQTLHVKLREHGLTRAPKAP